MGVVFVVLLLVWYAGRLLRSIRFSTALLVPRVLSAFRGRGVVPWVCIVGLGYGHRGLNTRGKLHIEWFQVSNRRRLFKSYTTSTQTE
jgi:hypothetical protein